MSLFWKCFQSLLTSWNFHLLWLPQTGWGQIGGSEVTLLQTCVTGKKMMTRRPLASRVYALSTVFDEGSDVVLTAGKGLGPKPHAALHVWALAVLCVTPCRCRKFFLVAWPVPIHFLLVFVFHFQLTGLFQFTVRLASETEARFTSVERINHYIKVRMRRPLLIFFFSFRHGWWVKRKEPYVLPLPHLYLRVCLE